MMDTKNKGMVITACSVVLFMLPVLLDEDLSIIVTTMITSLCTFCSILLMFAGHIMMYGGPSNKERIEDLEKRIETLER